MAKTYKLEKLKGTLKRVFLKDQYHLGSIDLTDPTKNHYIIGLFPKTKIHGLCASGKIRTIGISASSEADNNMEINDNASYGLIGNINTYGADCEVGKSTAVGGIINGNTYGADCEVGKSTAVGILFNGDSYEKTCNVKEATVTGTINITILKEGCTIERSLKSRGLLNMLEINERKTYGLFERSIINQD